MDRHDNLPRRRDGSGVHDFLWRYPLHRGETSSSASFTNAVYYAPISSGGIGTWKQATNFPFGVSTICATLSGNVYCFGGYDGSSVGEDNQVTYAPIATLTG